LGKRKNESTGEGELSKFAQKHGSGSIGKKNPDSVLGKEDLMLGVGPLQGETLSYEQKVRTKGKKEIGYVDRTMGMRTFSREWREVLR